MKNEIHLRLMEPEDIEEIYDLENSSDLWRHTLSGGPRSRRMITDYVLNATGDMAVDCQARFVIEVEGNIVGAVDLTAYDAVHQRAELGIAVKSDYRRRGYAAAAIRQLLDYCRNTLLLHQVYALVLDDNNPSVSLFCKLGFQPCALLPQWYRTPDGFQDVQFFVFFL